MYLITLQFITVWYLRIRKIAIFGFLAAFIFSSFGWFPARANATIPKYINFQGKLTKVSDGTNVANGTYAFEFKIYDALSSGNLLYTETYDQGSGACSKLTVTNGVFNTKLGSCNAISFDFTGGSLYISVNFAPTGVAYDGEMSPRKQLVSAPYAFVANSLNGDGTIDLADFDTDSDGKTTIAPDTAGDSLTITTAAADIQGIVIDASSADSTQTAGMIDLNVDSSTDTAILGLALDAATVADNAADTLYGNRTNFTVANDAGGSGTDTAYAEYISLTVTDASSTGTALYVDAGTGAGTEYAAVFVNGNVGIGDSSPSAPLEVGDGTDSLQISSVGDMTFVDANGTASITGPAGGALSVVAGASQALTLTGNNNSTWSTSSGSLVVQGASTLALTAAAGAVTVTSTGAGNDINLVAADLISILPSGFVVNVGGGTTRTAMRFLEPSGTGTDYAAIQSNADVTASYTWILPAADASGCIQSNGSGTLSISACGGGSQTPWTGDIDADGFDLNDLSNILLRETTGAPAGSDVALYRDNSGDLSANVLTGKTINLAVNGTDEYSFSSTALAMNSNNITGVGTALTAAAGLTITATSADLALATATSGNITIAPASTGSVQVTSAITSGTGTSSGLSVTANSITSGYAASITSTKAASFSGNLLDINLSDGTGASSNTGSLLMLTNSGTANANTAFYVKHYATGTNNLALRVDDVSGDTSPFVIDGTGNVGIGLTAPGSLLHTQQSSDSTNTAAPVAFDVNSVGAAGELTASSGTQTFARIAPIINQSSTAGYTTLAINNTETATGLGVKEALDIMLAGASRTTIASNGTVTLQDASSFITPYGGYGRFENHIKRSEEFDDDTDWIKTNVTDPTANTLTAPDGSTSAEVLTNSSDAGNACNFSATAAGSDTFTFSVWARSASGTQTFGLRVDAGATSCATANNVTGTEQTFAATTTWKRYSVTETFSSATGNVKTRIFPDTASGTGTDSIRVWGAQLEKQSSPGSYAITTSGTLTNTNRGQTLESNFTASSGFLYGKRHITTVTGAAVASSTQVGELVRMIDTTSSGVNSTTVRGLEVQGFSGTNLKGINTGIASFGYTFGLHGVTTAQANEQSQPAAVFADLDNGNAPTSGNAIRAYTNNATAADMLSVYQETTAYTGTVLNMSIANNSGDFDSGNFLLMVNNDNDTNTRGTLLSVDYEGQLKLTPSNGDDTEAILIDTRESSGTQSVFRVQSDVTSSNTDYFHIEADGTAFISVNGTATNFGICLASDGNVNNTEIVQCNGAPTDLAENFGTDDLTIESGDLVAATGEAYSVVLGDGTKTTKAWIGKTVKPYQNLLGVISTQPNNLYGGDNLFSEVENPRPVTLAGRVPVKVNMENGVIATGDYLTSSSTPGFAMRATKPGMVLGQALQSYDGNVGSNKIVVFINPFYYDPTVVVDERGNVQLQRGTSTTELVTQTVDTAAYIVKQQGSGDILHLQQDDITRFLVKNDGTAIINAQKVEDAEVIVSINSAGVEVFTINARGDAAITGIIIAKDDTFAGSIATLPDGTAEITFTYHLGTGKPVAQLTAESESPVFAQIQEWKKDNEENYTGFVIKTFGLDASPTSAVVHYNVTAKQEGYETFGQVTLSVVNTPANQPTISNGSLNTNNVEPIETAVGTAVGDSTTTPNEDATEESAPIDNKVEPTSASIDIAPTEAPASEASTLQPEQTIVSEQAPPTGIEATDTPTVIETEPVPMPAALPPAEPAATLDSSMGPEVVNE